MAPISGFSGSVFTPQPPPPSSRSVNPCHSHLPRPDDEEEAGEEPKVAAPTSGFSGVLTPPCNPRLMPPSWSRTKPRIRATLRPHLTPAAPHNAIGRVIIWGSALSPVSAYMQRQTV